MGRAREGLIDGQGPAAVITEIMDLIRLLGSIGEVLPKQSSYHIITWLAESAASAIAKSCYSGLKYC